jgi:hypothetical protein
VSASVHRENSLSSSGRRVSDENTHRDIEHSVENAQKGVLEQKVARRAWKFPLKGNRRVETLMRLSKSKSSKEITQGVCGRKTHSKS